MLTGRQILDARQLLRWGRRRLGRNAVISAQLLETVESSDGPARLTEEQEAAIRRACEAAGVEFVADGSAWRGARLRSDVV